VGLLPTKGLTLPLLPSAGTGIVVNCMAIGILAADRLGDRYLMRGHSL
jgi:cell division protein FtsW